MKNFTRTLLLGASLLTLGACTPTVTHHGNNIEDYQIRDLVPGQSTRSQILKLMGSPTTTAPFNENIWYYIGQETEKRGILDPEVTQERIIQVTFNEEGILESLHDIDNERLNIPLESDKTETHGNDVTVLQQFLGNLGRFNPQAK